MSEDLLRVWMQAKATRKIGGRVAHFIERHCAEHVGLEYHPYAHEVRPGYPQPAELVEKSELTTKSFRQMSDGEILGTPGIGKAGLALVRQFLPPLDPTRRDELAGAPDPRAHETPTLSALQSRRLKAKENSAFYRKAFAHLRPKKADEGQ